MSAGNGKPRAEWIPAIGAKVRHREGERVFTVREIEQDCFGWDVLCEDDEGRRQWIGSIDLRPA